MLVFHSGCEEGNVVMATSMQPDQAGKVNPVFNQTEMILKSGVQKGLPFLKKPIQMTQYRRTLISGTTFSGNKCLSGTIFHAI
jgi:hypothetical protein